VKQPTLGARTVKDSLDRTRQVMLGIGRTVVEL